MIMIKGRIVPLVTPMKNKGDITGIAGIADIDYEQLTNLVEWHIKEGTEGLVVVGTTGESVTLSAQESEQVIQHVVRVANKRIVVIAGTGTSATQETIEQTQRAKALGADAALIITPYYNRPTQTGLFLHYQAIAHAVPDFPIILYNNPGRTGCDLQVETVAKLSNVPGIYGIKDPTGDLNRVYEHRSRCRPGFKLYSGDDATCLNFMLAGGDGVITITANIAPKMMHDLVTALFSKQETLAREINTALSRLYKLLVIEPNPIPIKWALGQSKQISDAIRLPLTPLSVSYHRDILEQLTILGLHA